MTMKLLPLFYFTNLEFEPWAENISSELEQSLNILGYIEGKFRAGEPECSVWGDYRTYTGLFQAFSQPS